MTEVED